jgi:hypothetical protein
LRFSILVKRGSSSGAVPAASCILFLLFLWPFYFEFVKLPHLGFLFWKEHLSVSSMYSIKFIIPKLISHISVHGKWFTPIRVFNWHCKFKPMIFLNSSNKFSYIWQEGKDWWRPTGYESGQSFHTLFSPFTLKYSDLRALSILPCQLLCKLALL